MNNDKEKRLDEMLDAALAEYGNAEPLHGIEDRVLARLQNEPARRPWWVWGAVAAGAAAVAIAAALMMRPAEQPQPPVTAKQAPAVTAPQPRTAPTQQAHKEAAPAPVHARSAPVTVARAKTPPQTTGQPPISPALMGAKLPRRDVFPTPTPPSMEEILLARHVRSTPSDVVLAEAEREPLKFHYDDVPVPATHAGPQKNDSTK